MASDACTLEPPATAAVEWHQALPELVCAGFRLREPRLGDAEQLAAVFGPHAASRVGVAPPATSDGWLQFVAKSRTGRLARHTACFVVVRETAPDICGLVLLQRLAPGSGATTVSFIYPDSVWQTDLPVRSIACVLEFAFRCGSVRRVEGRAAGARELAPVRELGAVEEGVLRRSHVGIDGGGDQALWSILDTDWETRGGGAAFGLVRVEGADPSAGLTSDGADARPPDWTSRVPTLKGSLVTLREVGQLDVPVLLRALEPADLEVALAPAPTTSDTLRRYVSWVQLQRTVGRAVGFAIVPRGTRHAAGLLQVRRDDTSGLIAEWGIILAARYRGTGVAVEATELMAAFAFDELGAERLEARASGIDPQSMGLLRKLGAVREAHMRRSFIRGEEAMDDDLWAILKDDWRRRR